MKIVPESVNEHYTLIERKVIQIKTTLHIPEQMITKYATGLALNGKHKGKVILYMTYDQVEIDSFEKKLYLVPSHHVLCEVEAEEHEDVTDPFTLPTKSSEPWYNLKA